jgi:predicted nucleic acid-binding protein
MNVILIDNCVVLDFCQKERPRHTKVMEFIKTQIFSQQFISATTAERLYYQLDRYDVEKVKIDSFISQFNIMEVGTENIFMAQELCDKSSDYEDALEISICKLQKVDIFLTADKKLANKINKMSIKGLEIVVVK